MSKLTDRLAAVLKIHNNYQLIKLLQPDIWIDYSSGATGPFGYIDRTATVHFSHDGKRMKSEFRAPEIRNGHAERRACIEKAQRAASERFGVEEWVRLPFQYSDETWLPREECDRLMDILEKAEGES